MSRLAVFLTLPLALATGGCLSTKNYGRVTPVTPAETAAFDCKELAIEVAKVDSFLRFVDEESDTDYRSVGAFITDLGISNAMEKHYAEKFAQERLAGLKKAQTEKGCTPAPAKVAAAAVKPAN